MAERIDFLQTEQVLSYPVDADVIRLNLETDLALNL